MSIWFYRNGYRLISGCSKGKIYSLAVFCPCGSIETVYISGLFFSRVLSIWFYRNGYRLISGCSGGKIYSLAVFCLFGSIETVIGLSLAVVEVRFIL